MNSSSFYLSISIYFCKFLMIGIQQNIWNPRQYNIYISMYYLIRKELFLVLILISISKCQDSTPTPIHESLLGVSLKGQWVRSNVDTILGVQTYSPDKDKSQDSKFLTFFSTSSGKAEVLITQSSQGKSKASVHIQLLNNSYINDQVVQLAFDIGRGYNKTLNQWKTPKFLTPAKLFRNMKQVVTLDIVLNFQMKKNFKNQTQITLKSDSLNLVISLEPANYGRSYFILFTVINCIQILLLLVSGKNQTTLANTSQWLILQSSCFLIVQTLFLIKLGIGYFDTELSWLTVNVLTNILVMMLILRKFEVVLQKFKNKVKFILAFAFILTYFLMVYDFYSVPTFWIVQSMIFLWQIGYSIGRGGSGGVSIQLVIVVLLSRIPLLVLMKSEQNALKLRPDNMAANFIIACMSTHLLIIGLQKKFGGRFFTPKAIIPDYFNYLREALYGSEIAKVTCSICLNQLRQKPEEKQEESKNPMDAKKIQLLKQKKISYVCTPCNHCFHQKCLGDWLKEHLVCPLDKRGLPPINVGDV